jgi:hypothetical protein
MSRLVQADLTTPGQRDLRHGPPPCFFDLRAGDALLRQWSDLGGEVVTHQVELSSWDLGRMDRKLRGREPKDQPSTSRIDRVETEDASQKGPIGVCILAEEYEVSSENHGPMLI